MKGAARIIEELRELAEDYGRAMQNDAANWDWGVHSDEAKPAWAAFERAMLRVQGLLDRTTPPLPELDTCSRCGEHAKAVLEDNGPEVAKTWVSACCGYPFDSPDDYERFIDR